MDKRNIYDPTTGFIKDTVGLQRLIPKKPFKVKYWDCFKLCNWFRKEFDFLLLPNINFVYKSGVNAQTVLQQLTVLAIQTMTPKTGDLVCILDNDGTTNLGTVLLVKQNNLVELYVLHMTEYAHISKADTLKILSYWKYEPSIQNLG